MRRSEHPSYFLSILKETFQGISRNSLVASAASVAIVAALLILGLFMIFASNVASLTNSTEQSIQIQIFLKEGVSEAQKHNIEQSLLDNEKVQSVEFESKEQAFENFQESLSDYSNLLENYTATENPLPESFIVTAVNPEYLEEIRDEASEYSEVEYIRYEENFIKSLLSFTDYMNVLSAILLIIMSFVALFLIFNAIRLTVSSRKKEIEIMKTLGATNRFIRMPFILEGTFLGIVSAIISILIIGIAYYYVIGYVNGTLLMAFESMVLSPGVLLSIVLIAFLVYGILIGSFGAFLATRRFLNI